MKKPIPDNVNFEPISEIVTSKNNVNEASIVKHFINYAPKLDDDKQLEVLKLEKLGKIKLDNEDKNVKFVSLAEFNNCELDYDDYGSNNLTTGCNFGSISKIVTEIFKPHSQSKFYLEEANCSQTVSELDSSTFESTLKSCNNDACNKEFTTQIITKRKKHRSEIEINKQLNSSASSTISSTNTSIVVNDEKKPSELAKLTNGSAAFRSSEEVNDFFSNSTSTATNEDTYGETTQEESSDESGKSQLGSSFSSYESINKEQIRELNTQIDKEYAPGQKIKYNIDKKKRGLNMKSLKKAFRTNLRLPSDYN